jgi:hypothetical protein
VGALVSGKNKAAVELGTLGGRAKTERKSAASRANGRKGGRPTAYCHHCGWLVPAEGVTLPADVDLPRDGAQAERCTDGACVSDRVCDESGSIARQG